MPSEVVDAVELVASELITRSLRHGRGTIAVSWDQPQPGVSRLSVHDYDRKVPTPRTADDDEVDARGRALIEAIAKRCGVDREPAAGKARWAEFKLAAREIVIPDSASTDSAPSYRP